MRIYGYNTHMKKLLSFTILNLVFVGLLHAQALTTDERQSLPMVTTAFGSIVVGYSSIFTNTDKVAIKDLDILNVTNADITCSYNASDQHFEVPAYSSYSPDLGVMRKHESATISCKYRTGAPTVGNVHVSVGY
jgi:hypothetical protein